MWKYKMTYKQKDLEIALKCVTASENLDFNWKKKYQKHVNTHHPHYYHHHHSQAHWNQETGTIT